MFKSRTVFIVGAGASQEVGLPLGGDLAAEIGTMADVQFGSFNKHLGRGDHHLFVDMTSNFRTDAEDFQKAAWIIRDGIGLARSIDDFLSIHEHDQHVKLYGKAAIVRAVLNAERRSKLFYKREGTYSTIDYRQIADTWFVKFMKMLGPGSKVVSLFENTTFIVFNYDRCVEQFLSHAIRSLFNLSESDAQAAFSKARVMHPYGFLGPLENIPFGAEQIRCGGLASEIRTYAERLEEGTELGAIRASIGEAETLIFLGFGFHDENMDLLFSREKLVTAKRVFATAKGASTHDARYIRNRLIEAVHQDHEAFMRIEGNVHIRTDTTCSRLFDEYQKTMPATDDGLDALEPPREPPF